MNNYINQQLDHKHYHHLINKSEINNKNVMYIYIYIYVDRTIYKDELINTISN